MRRKRSYFRTCLLRLEGTLLPAPAINRVIICQSVRQNIKLCTSLRYVDVLINLKHQRYETKHRNSWEGRKIQITKPNQPVLQSKLQADESITRSYSWETASLFVVPFTTQEKISYHKTIRVLEVFLQRGYETCWCTELCLDRKWMTAIPFFHAHCIWQCYLFDDY